MAKFSCVFTNDVNNTLLLSESDTRWVCHRREFFSLSNFVVCYSILATKFVFISSMLGYDMIMEKMCSSLLLSATNIYFN